MLKPNQVSLVPDKYGKHLAVKQLTGLDENGEYTKHIPINEETLDTIKGSFLLNIPSLWIKHKDGTYGLGGEDMKEFIQRIANLMYELEEKNRIRNIQKEMQREMGFVNE